MCVWLSEVGETEGKGDIEDKLGHTEDDTIEFI